MSRAKPYDRPAGNPDLPWKHDLHASDRSLSARLGGGGPGAARAGTGKAHVPSLLARMHTAAGKELLPARAAGAGRAAAAPSGKLRGFTADDPARYASAANPNAAVELLPAGAAAARGAGAGGVSGAPGAASAVGAPLVDRLAGGTRGLVRSAFDGLGARPERRERNGGYQRVEAGGAARPVAPAAAASGPGLSISGASKVRVRVENLAAGTTAEDVVAAFAPSPITSAAVTQSAPTVSIELVVPDRATGDALVAAYDGVVADGNTLRLAVLAASAPRAEPARAGAGGGRELLGQDARARDGRDGRAGWSGRDRPDGRDGRDGRDDRDGRGARELLGRDDRGGRGLADRLDTRARARDSDRDRASQPRRAPAQTSLAARMGADARAPQSAGRSRGRGQIGGGSYADMLID